MELRNLLTAFLLICVLAEGTLALAGYRMVGEPVQISDGLRVNLTRVAENPGKLWEGESDTLTLDAIFQSDYRLRIKIFNDDESRFQVPLTIEQPSGSNQNPLYELQFENDPLFTFKVIRKSSGTVLFKSSPGDDFIFADQYLSLSWTPGSLNVYGLGENEQHSFRHDFSQNLTWALWAKDQPPDHTANMYGVHPHYTVLENDGNAHALMILNSNAQQFSMLSGPKIKYITTGGLLDFYIFLGPTPENTVQQYTEAVGRPQMPPYWGLGFQLCRHGYDNIETMKKVVNRTSFYEIPHDVQYADIDVMHKTLDFTYSRERFAGLPEYIKELKEKGIKFVTILDPCISTGENPDEYRPFKLGNEMDVWVKNANGEPVAGKVWPEDACRFPDYSRSSTKSWWTTLIKEFHDVLEYDGLWIDMNEPANFVDGDMNDGCAQNNLNYPPYVPPIRGDKLIAGTLCADHVQDAGKHYDVHSLYGWYEAEATLTGVREGTGKRSMILSRSTFLGSGRWTAHWLGDNWSRWTNLHYSIIGMLQFNQFGIPYVGADICGFLENSNAQMCQRWMELGAFYPFSRNHNVAGANEQDPGVWGPEVAESSRRALLARYELLPYLYTLFYESVKNGGTVARALWHEFPTDSNTWGIDTQFMWGSGLLISPVLKEGETQVDAYFPDARFYNFFSGEEQPTSGGSMVTLPTPMDAINVHVRGGNVLPTQDPAVNTQLSRQNPYGLIVALDNNGEATGYLFSDDGDSIGTIEDGKYFLARFTVQNQTLSTTVLSDGYPDMENQHLTSVRLLGVERKVVDVKGSFEGPIHFSTLPSGEVLISGLAGVNFTERFTIQWVTE